ncbi:adenosylcobinamide-phosphate synthase [Halopolyspora algeriensis]|uniref:Cobalamin biosynthesis protein CobD n=1 Tax=Halopolyspora algeriensis TaxID=1500506 RepID=A0A368VIZ9_9ACTN|nr:cobalamin biosynthesis protein [Halopolyspora algeriensis]RCW40705.1 adenosylcobinamide-phosphate synthase [Halopolyspora algeriensis]TQM53372.1 adenosylcobinamide-phosphate synthase [Halopolyspora algeriensis]
MSAGRAAGLVLGVAADAVLADPRRGHPVAAFGKVASTAEKLLHRDRRAAGVVHTVVLAGGTAALGVIVERLSRRVPVAHALVTGVVTWAVLGGTSLAGEGTAMARTLESGDLDAARGRLGHLCGRQAEGLDEQELARATVESVAENTSDAVVAPLVWGAVAGIPGLVGYRAVNTLDAMVGNRGTRYRNFGWASARLDDIVNLVPSRLAAALASLGAPVVGGSAADARRTWWRDASAHPSPNAGQIEAAFAGALGIRLGGRTVYGHAAESRPVLGDGRATEVGDVARSVELSRVIGYASGGLAAGAALLAGFRRERRRRR